MFLILEEAIVLEPEQVRYDRIQNLDEVHIQSLGHALEILLLNLGHERVQGALLLNPERVLGQEHLLHQERDRDLLQQEVLQEAEVRVAVEEKEVKILFL